MNAEQKEAEINPFTLISVQLQSLKFKVSFCSVKKHVFVCSMIMFQQCSSGQL